MNRHAARLTPVLLLLAGCVSSGMRHAEFKATLAQLRPNEGRIYFYRESSFVGSAIQPEIFLNGAVVGTSRPGGFFVVERPAGRYEASTSTEVERKLTFTLEEGETKYVRTHPSFGVIAGRINFELVNAAEAEGQLASLHLTGVEPPPMQAQPPVAPEAPRSVPPAPAAPAPGS